MITTNFGNLSIEIIAKSCGWKLLNLSNDDIPKGLLETYLDYQKGWMLCYEPKNT